MLQVLQGHISIQEIWSAGATDRALPQGVPAYAANAGLSAAPPLQRPPMYPAGANIAGGPSAGSTAGAQKHFVFVSIMQTYSIVLPAGIHSVTCGLHICRAATLKCCS